MNKTEQYVERFHQVSSNHYGQYSIVFDSAHGVWLKDIEGKEYLDCVSSYSALPFGHTYQPLIQVAQEQLAKMHLCGGFVHHVGHEPVLRKLTETLGLDKALLMNSGAEGVEAAIKVSRKWGYVKKNVPLDQAEIIVCNNNFHGRTTTIVGFSSTKQYKEKFGPATPGFVSVPFGDTEALEAAITPNTVAFLMEPGQGEGGIVMPPEDYLSKAQGICRKHNVLLVLDEIQTGLGRTGRWFAHQHEDGVKPDVIILGKALSGGISPVSAVIGTEDVLGVFEPGDHGSTFASNPLACAVAKKSIELMEELDLPAQSHEKGAYLKEKLSAIDTPYIKMVRGKGLFIGMVLSEHAPDSEALIMKLFDAGLMINSTKGAIRVTPPLTITYEEMDELVKRMASVLVV